MERLVGLLAEIEEIVVSEIALPGSWPVRLLVVETRRHGRLAIDPDWGEEAIATTLRDLVSRA